MDQCYLVTAARISFLFFRILSRQDCLLIRQNFGVSHIFISPWIFSENSLSLGGSSGWRVPLPSKGRPDGSGTRYSVLEVRGGGLGLFAAINAGDAAHQAAQGQPTFNVSEENFSRPGAAIEPAFE